MGIQDDGKDTYKRDTIRPTYGGEAVIPTEVGLISYRMHNHDENKNDEAMRLQLDLVDEIRTAANKGLLGTRTA